MWNQAGPHPSNAKAARSTAARSATSPTCAPCNQLCSLLRLCLEFPSRFPESGLPLRCSATGGSLADIGRAVTVLRTVADEETWASRPWTGLWTGSPDNPSVVSAVSAMPRGICAVRTVSARGRTSCKRQVSGSIPLTGSRSRGREFAAAPSVGDESWDECPRAELCAELPCCYAQSCPRLHRATTERVVPCLGVVGTDPLTRRQIRLKATAKTEQQAHTELGRLLKEASEGRTPESGATMAKLLEEYAAIAPWDVPTRQTNEGFIRRTIMPALGHLEVRKVRGPILDQLYTRLKRCGDLACTGRPFTEHRNIPALVSNPGDPRRPCSGSLRRWPRPSGPGSSPQAMICPRSPG